MRKSHLYCVAAPEAFCNPYVTAGASVIWMSWEYRNPVDSNNYGLITRDYLEGIDGYAGLGLKLRWRKHLDFFGELDVGGTGFLPTTYSGDHNNLFANFDYAGIRGRTQSEVLKSPGKMTDASEEA